MKLTIFAAVAACTSAIDLRRIDPELATTMESLKESEKDLGTKMGTPINMFEAARRENHKVVNYMTDDMRTFYREEAEDRQEEMDTYKEAESEVKAIRAKQAEAAQHEKEAEMMAKAQEHKVAEDKEKTAEEAEAEHMQEDVFAMRSASW